MSVDAPDSEYHAPAPILTGEGIARPAATGWAAAPPAARDSWQLSLLGTAVYTCAALVYLVNALNNSVPDVRAVTWVIAILFTGIAAGNWYLALNVKKGTPAAWTVQLVLSCLGLLGFPLLTLIHGLLLAKWFKPETKSWFGRA